MPRSASKSWDALMMYGLTQHDCAALGRTILLPISIEKYNSKLIVSAKCHACTKNEFETSVDKLKEPSKGFYMTV